MGKETFHVSLFIQMQMKIIQLYPISKADLTPTGGFCLYYSLKLYSCLSKLLNVALSLFLQSRRYQINVNTVLCIPSDLHSC